MVLMQWMFEASVVMMMMATMMMMAPTLVLMVWVMKMLINQYENVVQDGDVDCGGDGDDDDDDDDGDDGFSNSESLAATSETRRTWPDAAATQNVGRCAEMLVEDDGGAQTANRS